MLLLSFWVVACAVGAFISKREDLHWAWYYAPALACATLWIHRARAGGQLATAAPLWDVVAAVTYLCAIIALGERPALVQYLGILCAVIGCVLMGQGAK